MSGRDRSGPASQYPRSSPSTRNHVRGDPPVRLGHAREGDLVTQTHRLLVLGAAGLLALVVALAAGASTDATNLVVIGTALAAGYVFELRPDGRSPLPVALAFIVVLLRAASPAEFVAIACIAPLAAMAVRTQPRRLADRALLLAEFLAEGLGAGAAFYSIMRAGRSADPGVVVFCALAGSVVVQLVVADAVTLVRAGYVARLRGRGADLVLATSGMLMAIGYGGVGRQGRLGLWGPLLFSIPLVAAWYSYELFARTRRTFEQTVQALGVVPELGGLARQGHVERVARLAVSLGEQLGVGGANLRDLETAAWLHHLGAVSLDDAQAGSPLDLADVASASADMLRSSNALCKCWGHCGRRTCAAPHGGPASRHAGRPHGADP